ncbi:hypothetical protein [Maricaulis sp.]|uniref:hypothetical protein n=1 Tax=Maricaulis sp. TaxID=1486257 RepID=UPI003A90E1BB
MAEISRVLSVPASTLYQWAARGEWRLQDLADAELPADLAAPDRPAPEESGEPPTALEAAQSMLEQAGRAAVAGQIMRSERAAKLARQLFGLAEQAQRVEAAEAALHPKEVGLSAAEVEALRDELRQRLFPHSLAPSPEDHPDQEAAPGPSIRRL